MIEKQFDDNLMKKLWVLGWNDRGLGHGDYGLMVDGEVFLGPIANYDLAEHIIRLHNTWLEQQNVQK